MAAPSLTCKELLCESCNMCDCTFLSGYFNMQAPQNHYMMGCIDTEPVD